MAPNPEAVLTFCRSWAFTLLLLAYFFYLAVGGVIFMALEQSEQDLLVADVHELRVRFLEKNQCVNKSSLEHLLRKILLAGKRGVAVLKADSDEYNFDFTSSLFFVTTFLTTTGYGTTVPLSDEGRLFCILYCLFGIPLTFILLSSLTHALVPRVTHSPIHHLHIHWGLPYNTAAVLYCGILAVSTATLFFLLPALVLCLLEREWSFLESLYYCFISLSTIGLGDYLPGRTQSRAGRQALEFFTSCYLLLGLVVLLVVMESFWKLQQVQALVRFFVGPWVTELQGVDLDELELSEGPDSDSPAEDTRYMSPISIISHSLPTANPVEKTFTLGSLHRANLEKSVHHSFNLSDIPESDQPNN
ncbi:potassium channel, subfamily K, member 7 [Trichomycterus rosablanca]|uniref:potassium channel, subfamily K, member 7 n=1 Tax=Trichomycterus rosablanca TaxID=2290929 RepID=UPI002F3519D6